MTIPLPLLRYALIIYMLVKSMDILTKWGWEVWLTALATIAAIMFLLELFL